MSNEEIVKENRKKIIEDRNDRMFTALNELNKNLETLRSNISILKFKNTIGEYKISSIYLLTSLIALLGVLKENYIILFFYLSIILLQSIIENILIYKLNKEKIHIVKVVLATIVFILCITKVFSLM